MRSRAALATVGAALGVLVASSTHADGSLRAQLGVRAAETLEASDSEDDRLQALERLRGVGTPRAVARLVDALDPGGKAVTPKERLTAVRALAEHTDDANVRRALVRVLGGHATPSSASARSALDNLAEDTAALALARAGTSDALAALGKALGVSDRAAEASSRALAAYPPRDLGPLLGGAKSRTLELVAALDALGDQRAFATLRDVVRTGTVDVQARAALALTRLGDYETVELARKWRAGESAVLRVTAAKILAMAHDRDASEAITALLRAPDTVDAGIELALDAPAASLVPELARLLETAEADRAADLIAALGRAGGAPAVKILAAALSHPEREALAAYALARMDGGLARHALERALARRETTRLAAGAGAIRYFALGDTVPGLEATLTRLSRSPDTADRAAGAAGLAVLHPDRIDGFLATRDDSIVRSVAGCLLLAPDRVASAAVARLSDTTNGRTRSALALALAVPGAAEQAPTSVLVALVDAGGAAAPLAARALAERDDPRDRGTTDALLANGDPWIRAHAALGLGRSREPNATGRLEDAYRFETEPEVRAAIVRALSGRPESTRLRPLTLAANLDPDVTVRTLGRRASEGAELPTVERGTSSLWLPVAESRSGAPGDAAVAVRVPGGLVLPVSTGPDGLAVAVGLPAGPVIVRVAPAHERDDDHGKGATDK